MKDSYYHFLKSQGSMDFIDQLITPEENENGIRLDTKLNFPLTILATKITAQNCTNLLGQIKNISGN